MHIVDSFLKQGLLPIVWFVTILIIVLLGFLRTLTSAEFVFASAAIIPVFLVSWQGNFIHGSVASILASIMWVVADHMSGKQIDGAWMPFVNGSIQLIIYIVIAYLTARIHTLLAREVQMATHDALTGLLNRRAFFAKGEAEASRSMRYGHDVTIIFIDLDNFKQLNDTWGHAAGDKALKAVADALQQSLRATDQVARLGGDEFAVLLPEISPNEATVAGQKIASAVATAVSRFTPVSASIGVACFVGGMNDFAAMLKSADALMYESKQAGKGGILVRLFSARKPNLT